jgi:anaerobic magnesium-protoporphyrin IX monomethyl ester cyclase
MTRGGTFWFPIWLSYTTGVLEKEGLQVRLADAPAWKWNEERMLRDAHAFDPQLVIVDSNFSTLTNDCRVAQLLGQSLPGATTVLVGPPAGYFAEQILSQFDIDVVARLEYDYTVRDLAQAVEEGKEFKDILGISYRIDRRIVHNPDREFISSEELDRIPFVSSVYGSRLTIEAYSLDHTLHPEVQIFTGRGCPNLCTFCSWPENLMGRKYRVRSVQNVVDEMQYIAEELPVVKEIFIEDDTFTISRRRVKEVCEEIKNRKLKITWSCNARADLDLETMHAMKSAGCRLLDVGYESGSDEILKNIKKGISTDRMKKFAREARRAGLMVLGDFIIGLPGETKETIRQTIRFAKELKPNLIQFAVATPLPGTQFYKWAATEGFLLTEDLEESLDDGGFQRCIISYPEFNNRDIEIWVDRALKSYYLTPSYVPIALRSILRRNGFHELKGLMKSARTFLEYLRSRKEDTERHIKPPKGTGSMSQ